MFPILFIFTSDIQCSSKCYLKYYFVAVLVFLSKKQVCYWKVLFNAQLLVKFQLCQNQDTTAVLYQLIGHAKLIAQGANRSGNNNLTV